MGFRYIISVVDRFLKGKDQLIMQKRLPDCRYDLLLMIDIKIEITLLEQIVQYRLFHIRIKAHVLTVIHLHKLWRHFRQRGDMEMNLRKRFDDLRTMFDPV